MNVKEARALQEQGKKQEKLEVFIKNTYPKILESVINNAEDKIRENASLGKSNYYYKIRGSGCYNLAIALICREYAKTEEQQQYVKEHIEQDLVDYFIKEGFEAKITTYDEMRSIIDLYIRWGE